MNASSNRPTIRPPYSYRMSGVDGTLNGYLRPHPGFTEVHRFRSSDWGSNHDNTSVILEMFQFPFVIGETGYGYGFVIRVRRKNLSMLSDVFVDYWNSKTGNWVRGQLVKAGIPLSRDYDRKTGVQMSVSPWGRYVYVYIEDQEPVAFAVDGDSPYAFQLVTDTGPGRIPKLVSPGNAIALGGITTLADADRPGNAQVVMIEFKPSEVPIVAGSSSPQPAIEDTISTLKPGDYTFAYHLFDSKTGRRSALSDIAQVRSDLFDEDGTGPIEPIDLYAVIEITYDASKYDQAYVYRSVRVQGAGGTYIGTIHHLDRILTLADYHSTNNPLANPNYKQAIYWYELEDKPLAAQQIFPENTAFDENLPKGGASLLYDGTMLVSKIRTPSASSADVNRANDALKGTGELKWSSLRDISPELFPPSNVYYPRITTNEIVSLIPLSPNVIGFSADRQYHIRKEGDYIRVQEVHEGYGVVNPKAADTIGSFIYFISNNGLKAVDVNARLDDVQSVNEFILNQWKQDYLTLSVAFDPAVNCFFILNRVKQQALVFWMNTAKTTLLEDLPFHQCVRGVWPESFTFNPTALDAGGEDNETYYNAQVERAFFFQNPPTDTGLDIITGFEYRVFMVDHRRERVKFDGMVNAVSISNQPDRCLLPMPGNSVFNITSDFSAGADLEIDLSNGEYLTETMWGYFVYVLKAADPTLVGARAQIKKVNTGDGLLTLTAATKANFYGLASGDVIGVCPATVEWQGAPLPYSVESGQGEVPIPDYFRVRHISSIGCSFSDVDGLNMIPNANLARYLALAYKGSDEEPMAVGTTYNPQDGTERQSIKDHEGNVYASFKGTGADGAHGVDATFLTPGIRIICPDLDYKLVSVRVVGSIRESITTESLE